MKDTGILLLAVGQPHPAMGQRLPLNDGMVAGVLGGMPALVIGLQRPVEREVRAVERGALAIGLIPMRPHGYAWEMASSSTLSATSRSANSRRAIKLRR